MNNESISEGMSRNHSELMPFNIIDLLIGGTAA